MDFTQAQSDTSLYILSQGKVCLFILVYVDDIIVTESSDSMISSIISMLSVKFAVKDMGDLTFFWYWGYSLSGRFVSFSA